MKNIFKKLVITVCAIGVAASFACFAGCSEDPAPTPTPTPTPSVDDPVDTAITFDGETVTTSLTESDGVTISGGTVTITAAGEYEFKGTATDGNIIVSVAKTEKVTLVLSGVDITSKTTAPIFIASADKVNIVLTDGTTNVLTDPSDYVYEANATKPNACIYGKDDFEIKGNGSLKVNANFNNGIGCKNDIKITGGTITISAVNNAIKGKDSVQISGGAKVTITSCSDGIKTENETEADKGYITLDNCTVSITADDDGIVSNNMLTITSTAKVTYNVQGKTYFSRTSQYGGVLAN